MASLFDVILGSLSGNGTMGGIPPDMAGLPSSGYLEPPPDPRDMSIRGFPPGGPPLPRPRPPEAGPAMTSAPAAMPADDAGGIMPGPIGGAPMPTAPQQQPQGGLMSALGLNNPDTLRSAVAALGGGLKNVKNSPFKGEVFAQAAGNGIEAGDTENNTLYKQKMDALDRALKLKQIKELGSYRDDITDVRRNQVGVNQQNADTNVTKAGNTLVLGKEKNGISQQRADTAADVAPSTIRRNEASANVNDARAARQRGEVDMTEPVSKRAARADAASDRFYKPRLTQLTQEKMRIQAMPGTPQQKLQASSDIDLKIQDLERDYAKLKQDNYRIHGVGPNGEDLAPRGKAPGTTSISPNRPQKSAMGTREDPHEPKSPQDFDAIQPGQVFRDPGDGKLYEK